MAACPMSSYIPLLLPGIMDVAITTALTTAAGVKSSRRLFAIRIIDPHLGRFRSPDNHPAVSQVNTLAVSHSVLIGDMSLEKLNRVLRFFQFVQQEL